MRGHGRKFWTKKRWEKEALREWREGIDAVARAENALMRYYVRRAKGEIRLEVLAAA